MRFAITGGTGFVGRHLGRALAKAGHEVVLVSRGRDMRDERVRSEPGITFAPVGVHDARGLATAFAGCEGVAHFAGINREIGDQTFRAVHVEGTRNVLEAARRSGVRKVVLLSFLRARPRCGSGYHESKWEAEELVRASGLDFTILKAGIIYGLGDHLLDHVARSLRTIPLFGLLGRRETPIRPVAVEDLVRIAVAALVDRRLERATVPVLGPERLSLRTLVARIGSAVGRPPLFIPLPMFAHGLLARTLEAVMRIPLIAVAQLRILSEGVADPLDGADRLPPDLEPSTPFAPDQIRRGLPDLHPFSLADLRCCAEV